MCHVAGDPNLEWMNERLLERIRTESNPTASVTLVIPAGDRR
jgi:hypothetical protein